MTRNTEITARVAESLRTAATDRGVTDAMIADRAHLSRYMVRHYLAGTRDIHMTPFLDMCAVIGINPEDVLTLALPQGPTTGA